MVVPGSLGVAPSHLAHAEALTDDGFAAFVLDSFGARGVDVHRRQPDPVFLCGQRL